MATITYDDRSFLLDGRRIWLVSGEIHYFRIPNALWPDRLLKAKRGGLNCISTCIPWNFHEPREGVWDLSDDHDVAAFVRMAGELGLYVILRPGPYIRAEWDFGGLPGWLSAKSGVSYRTSNAAFMHYFDKYFAQVLPQLAELQVTRNGPVVLIQNETEYLRTTMPDRLSYLEFISQLFRRSGFEIPIITCNHLTTPPVPDTVECVNNWGSEVQRLKQLRLRQPSAPMLVTEFRMGRPDAWGAEHETREPREVARRAMEILGCGAQYNYYPWCGGTNFAFWAPRLTGCDASYHTTSHDFNAPVAEGGGLTETYYFARLANLTARHMGPYLAGTVMDYPAANIHDATDVLNLSGPRGRWAVVTNNGKHEVRQVRISLADGVELDVPLAPFGAAAVPAELELGPETRLDYTNLTPLGLFGERILVLHGPAGWRARVSINGTELEAAVPAGDEPKTIEHEGLSVVLINSDLAMRTWVVDGSLVLGPTFVGESAEEVSAPRDGKQYTIVPFEGSPTRKKYKAPVPANPAPRLGSWKRLSVCGEPLAAELEWTQIDRPRGVDRLGAHYGYVWYRIEIDAPRAAKRHLFLPECEDRATIHVNGTRVGTWGRGDDATRCPLITSFRKGANHVVLLVDNLGRFCDEPCLGETKGICGHLYDARPLRTKKFKVKAFSEFTRRLVPRLLSHLVPELEAGPIWAAEVAITLPQVTPVHISFTDIPHHLCVLCNDRVVRLFPKTRTGRSFGDVTLGSELRKGRNMVRLLLWGDLEPKTLDNVKFRLLQENLSQDASWSVRPLAFPESAGPTKGERRSTWFVAKFGYQQRDDPLFLKIAGAKKGQLFINGHNAGRFWTIGPQEYYYLPACWLDAHNELVLFEERGHTPTGSKLIFRPRGPYRE